MGRREHRVDLAGPVVDSPRLRGLAAHRRIHDLLWNYLAIDHYERLVLQRNWTRARFEAWLAGAITSTLVDHGQP